MGVLPHNVMPPTALKPKVNPVSPLEAKSEESHSQGRVKRNGVQTAEDRWMHIAGGVEAESRRAGRDEGGSRTLRRSAGGCTKRLGAAGTRGTMWKTASASPPSREDDPG